MSTVYVRDVSEDSIEIMKARAARAGRSLQAYVRDLIEREAAFPELAEAAAEAGAIAELNRANGPVHNADVLDAIDAGRAGR